MYPKSAPAPQHKKSTGPRTQAGKAASSQNAIRHGLASGTLLIPGEDRAEWQALLSSLIDEWNPATATERLLIQNMAKHHWLVERAIRLQGEALAAVTEPGTLPASFALLLRYQTTNERAFTRALKSLEEMRRTKAEFVSQKAKEDFKARESAALAFVTRPFPPLNLAADYEKFRAGQLTNASAVPQPGK